VSTVVTSNQSQAHELPSPQEAVPQASRPHLRITPRTPWAVIELRELWSFRDLLFTLAGRDLKLRYRQTMMGIIWVILQPLAGAAILAIIFGRLAQMPTEGLPPFLFTFAGLLCWQLFSGVVGKASPSMITNSHLVSKVYFPRMILPLSTAISTLVDFVVGFMVMIVLLVMYGVRPGSEVLLLPVWLMLTLILAMGLGLIASSLAVYYRDVNHIVPVILQFLFLGSPIAYSLAGVGERGSNRMEAAFLINPLTTLLEGLRWSLLGRGHFSAGSLTYAVVVSLGAFVIGACAFKRMEERMADVI
jgi:lipopolysaccharide transport system permease protein